MTSLPTPSFKASIVTMCSIAFYLIIWNSYQDKRAAGWTFYAFFCVGLASMVFIQVGYFLPFLWLMMMVFTNSFSIRNFFASIIGRGHALLVLSGLLCLYRQHAMVWLSHFCRIHQLSRNCSIIRRLPTMR